MSVPIKLSVKLIEGDGSWRDLRYVYFSPAALKRLGFVQKQLVSVKHYDGSSIGIVQVPRGVNLGPFEVGISSQFAEWANVKVGQRVNAVKYAHPLKDVESLKITCGPNSEGTPFSESEIKKTLLEMRYVHLGMLYSAQSSNTTKSLIPGSVPPSISNHLQHDGDSFPPGCIKVDEIHVRSPSNLLEAISDLSLEEPRLYRFTASSEMDVEGAFQSEMFQSQTSLSSSVVEISQNQQETSSPPVTFSSIGGLDHQIQQVRDVIELPFQSPELFEYFHISPPRGILLYGPPGTGKTMILRAIAAETNARVFRIDGPSVVGKYMGETEARLKKIFDDARSQQPSIIFIDEVDAIAPKRTADISEAESRAVASLLTLLDGMSSAGKVAVFAATNRPNFIDEALRRPGRLEKEIEVGIPDKNARLDILKLLFENVPNTLSPEEMEDLAGRTHAYVGADLTAVVREAALRAIKRALRIRNEAGDATTKETPGAVELDDVELALTSVRQSAMREFIIESPNVKWSQIGGQEDVKQKLKESVEWPLTHPETFSRLGVRPPKGILLYGPPGCSKTLTAKAIATETGLNFISVKGPELFNKYIGESERAVRQLFQKARQASPSVIFFDEIDALTGSRGGDHSGDRVVTALLNEMDGIEALKNVLVLAATNRPDVIDPALMRPGRLDRLFYVGPPNFEARRQILLIQTRQMKFTEGIDLEDIALRTEGCSGAEIVALCQDAGLVAMHENVEATEITQAHFEKALLALRKGINQGMLDFYNQFAEGVSTKVSSG
ncbi:ribosome biogenesis factor recycling AAA family ATPase [Schizosaccharomyces osmophilus]|uniref:Ribosome biogenesis factor recycling AAA family ATPase n=1 Tax=Schizosaccharomyces osmophilus TaxID=2545709 RepID=A0AAE9W736_9SCHI|nr:ribosome biogenesis factor recycling AAA family ATPase [Schizosaccharomyces osmophilus]WBW70734.1 ribosome biogenesis factor recycling AAA family ATPase [Schizosaccharomyces osmophilus]